MENLRLLLLLVCFISLTSCTSVRSSLCKIKGGEPYINLGGYQYCGERFSDGGKMCHSSEECQGECVLAVDWDPKDGKEIVGRCRSDNTWYLGYGCLPIEKHQSVSACIEE